MQRRDFLQNTLAIGATATLPESGLASGVLRNSPQGTALQKNVEAHVQELSGKIIPYDKFIELLAEDFRQQPFDMDYKF